MLAVDASKCPETFFRKKIFELTTFLDNIEQTEHKFKQNLITREEYNLDKVFLIKSLYENLKSLLRNDYIWLFYHNNLVTYLMCA